MLPQDFVMLPAANSVRRARSSRCCLVCCSCDFVIMQQWFLTVAMFRFCNNFRMDVAWNRALMLLCMLQKWFFLMFQQFCFDIARTVQWETSPSDVRALAGSIWNQRGIYIDHLVNLSTLCTYSYMKLTNIKLSLNCENEHTYHTLPSTMWLEMESQLSMERRGANANWTGAWIGGIGAWLRDEWVL